MSCCATVEVFSFQTSVSLDLLCFELSFVLSPPSLWSAFERDYQVRALNSSCYAESLSDISTCFIVSFEGGVSSSAFSLKSRSLSMPYAQKGKSCHSLLWNILGCSCMIWTLWPSGQGVGLLSRWGLPASHRCRFSSFDARRHVREGTGRSTAGIGSSAKLSTKQFSHDSRTGMEFLILMSLSVATLRRVKCVVSNLDVKQSYALIVFNDTKFISLSPTEPSIIIISSVLTNMTVGQSFPTKTEMGMVEVQSFPSWCHHQ